MTTTHILGYPRIGPQRELKFALENFWLGKSSVSELQATAAQLRAANWAKQRDAGLRFAAVGDFALYDHMLDTAALLGALPARFGFDARTLGLEQYFALARGNAAQPAMEMTKWFDTNYHYMVPEFVSSSTFDGGFDALFDRVREAQAAGHAPKPVLIGPLTFLWLSKSHQPGFDRLSLAPALSRAYALSDGILECVEVDTGRRRWRDRRGDYGPGQILLVGDVILVQAESGEVVMVEANPDRLVELGRIPALTDQTWNNLCLYDHYLLVRNSVEAACYDLPLRTASDAPDAAR